MLTFRYFGIFQIISLLLIPSLIPLLSKDVFCINSVVLNLWRCVLWHRMWFVLVSFPCVLEKDVYCAVVGWIILWVSVRPSWLMVQTVYILIIFCLLGLSLTNRGSGVSCWNGGFIYFSLEFFLGFSSYILMLSL